MERGSWSVRLVWSGARFPSGRSHRRQQVPSGRRRRGTSSACVTKRPHSTWRRPRSALHARGHVLHSVQRPVHVILRLPCPPPPRHASVAEAGAGRDEAVRVDIEVGQTCASGRNRPGVEEDRNDALRGSPRVTAGRGNSTRSCVTRQKRKVVMAIVPARKREPRAQRPYVGMQLQKSAGSILASNKLARSAPKRVAVRVNGGLDRNGVRHVSV